MALHEVGLLVYSQGFAISRDEYIIRELAFCDWTGHHHALFKYLLPKGVSYNQLSEEVKTRVDRQTKTVHGLLFEPYTAYNRHEFHPYHQIKDDISRWCQQYLTPQRGRLGVFTLNGLYRLFQEPRFSYPIVVLEGQGCRDLPIFPSPPSMSWPPTIRAVIGAWIIPTGNVEVGSGTIIALTCGSVK